MLWLILALVLERLLVIIAGPNTGAPWNGLGAVDGVLNKTGHAPQVYRVLVPWTIGALEWAIPWLKPRRDIVYSALRTGLTWLALWSCEQAIGREGALIVAGLLAGTVFYDYWDWAPELAGFALAMTGDFGLGLAGAVLLGLSRETVFFLPVLVLFGANPVCIFGATVWFTVLFIQGHHPRYCPVFMLKRNWQELKSVLTTRPIWAANITFSVVVSFLTLWACFQGVTAWPVAILVLFLGWTCGVASETRIFAPCLLFIANSLTKN